MGLIPDAEPVMTWRQGETGREVVLLTSLTSREILLTRNPFDQFLKTLYVWQWLKMRKLCLIRSWLKSANNIYHQSKLVQELTASAQKCKFFWQLTIFFFANSCLGRNETHKNCVTALAHLCRSCLVMKFGLKTNSKFCRWSKSVLFLLSS